VHTSLTLSFRRTGVRYSLSYTKKGIGRLNLVITPELKHSVPVVVEAMTNAQRRIEKGFKQADGYAVTDLELRSLELQYMRIAATGEYTTEELDHIFEQIDELNTLETVQSCCCTFLEYLTAFPDHENVIMDAGVVDAVVDVMATPGKCLHVQSRCCSFIANLRICEEILPIIMASGAIRLVLSLIGRCDDRVSSTQELCMQALVNMADSEQTSEVVVLAGGIGVVVELMWNHFHIRSIQELGCRLLGVIAHRTPHAAQDLVDAKGIDAVVGAMQPEQGNTRYHQIGRQEVLVGACWALCKFAKNPTTRPEVVYNWGVHMIVEAMKGYEGCQHLQQWACTALADIASDNFLHESILEQGCIGLIVNAMRTHSESLEVQFACSIGLEKLSWSNVSNAVAEIIKEGGIKVVLDTMRSIEATHPRDCKQLYAHVERCCNILTNLANDSDENKIAIVGAGGVEVVVGMMRTIKSSDIVQEAALLFLELYGPDQTPEAGAGVQIEEVGGE
jgi:hypothetical protein